MAPCRCLVVPVLLALLVSPHLLRAQVPDSTAKKDTSFALPPIEVVGSILPFAGVNVGSGIPALSTKIEWNETDATDPQLLPNVLQQLSGFSTFDNLGAPHKINVSTRGFYASPVVGTPQGVSVFVDGVRVNEPDAAEVNFDLLPMDHLKRVEVLSGNGTLLGRNSLGGSINLVTRRGETGPPSGDISVYGGNYDAWSGDADVGGTLKNGIDYYVGGGYNSENGWRQATKDNQWNVFTNVGKLGPTEGIRAQFYFAHSYAQTAGSLPEVVFDLKPDSNLTAGDYEDLNGLSAAIAGYKQMGNGRGSFNIYYRYMEATRFNVNQEDDPDSFNDATNSVFGGTLDYRFGIAVGKSAIGLRFGLDGSIAASTVKLLADSSKFDGPTVTTTYVKSPLWDVGVFGLADYPVGNVTLSAGARFDYVKIPFNNQLDPTNDTTSAYPHFDPRIGIDVNTGHGSSVFASLGTSFRAPSLIEVACADPEEPCILPFSLGDDPPIKPVTVTTIEVGARYSTSHVQLGATAYWSDVHNDIYLFPTPDELDGSTIQGYFGNIAKTRRVGIELSSRFIVGKYTSLYANYAYTKATFQSEAEIFSVLEDEGINNTVEPGDKIPLVPESQFKAGAAFTFPFGLIAGADVQWIGSQVYQQDEANNMPEMPSYFVANARVGWIWGPWKANFVVNNLFNARYATYGTFNVNQGDPLQPIVPFLTPGYAAQFRFIVTRSFGGGDRD